MSVSSRGGARGFKHLPFLNDAIEWKSRFTLGQNVSKSTDYIEKYFNQKSSKIKFPTKTLLGGSISSLSQKKTYVSNYAFVTLLHEWIDRGQTHQLEKLLCV